MHLGEFVIEARVWLNDCDLLGISNMQLTYSNEYTKLDVKGVKGEEVCTKIGQNKGGLSELH